MSLYSFSGEHVYDDLVLPRAIPRNRVEVVREMSSVDGDVFVATYPKTGTTWTGELVWNIMQSSSARDAKIYERMDYLESTHSRVDEKTLSDIQRNPLIIKTHLRFPYLGKVLAQGLAKVIVVIRNPKDTLVSLYHFYQMNANLGNFPGSWDDFFELYQTKHVLYGDFFDWYSSWLPYLDKKSTCFIKYEDMQENLRGVIRQVSEFLGKPVSDYKVETVAEMCSFGVMKANDKVNLSSLEPIKGQFMRSGKVGDWKNYFSPEQSAYVEDLYRHRLESKGIKLKFDSD